MNLVVNGHGQGARAMEAPAVRRASLAILSVAVVCAVVLVARAGDGRRPDDLLGWLDTHYDSQLGYSGLRTTVPADVAYKTPWSATPIGIPGEGAVSPYPMPTTFFIHRALPSVVMQQPAIRQTTTTSFSDTPTAPGAGVTGASPVVSPLASALPSSPPLVRPAAQYAAAGWNTYWTQPSSTYVPSAFAPGGQLLAGRVPPGYMHPQFLGMLSMGSAGGMPNAGFMPGQAYDMRTQAQLQRGFVPIRVAIPSAAMPLPALPRLTSPLFHAAGPQMAYDANNINSGLFPGSDVNPSLGLPAVPVLTVTKKQASSETASEMPAEQGNVTAAAGPAAEGTSSGSLALPPGEEIPLCGTELIVIDKSQAGSSEQAPCESLDDAKKKLGAAAYASIEVPPTSSRPPIACLPVGRFHFRHDPDAFFAGDH